MPTNLKIKGIILKIVDTPGKDKLLYILTENGLFNAFITPKRNAGKKSYIFDLFTLGEFVLYTTDKGNNLVNMITPEESFYYLREDLVKLSAAGYFASLAIHACADAETDFAALYLLTVSALKTLSLDCNVKVIKPIFEMKLIQLLGFTPCLEADKKSNTYYFDLSDGRLYVQYFNGGIKVEREVVLAIYNILINPIDKVFSLPKCRQADLLYYTVQNYVLYHLERDFDSLKFLNGVI